LAAQESHLTGGNAAQIIGKVNPDLSIKVLSSTDLGGNVGESTLLLPPPPPLRVLTMAQI
jgi:hypothetical protein